MVALAKPSAPMQAGPSSSSTSPASSLSSSERLWQSRWLVFVPSLWVQSCAGVAYTFGSYSVLLKSILGYSQEQITILGIAKDIGGTFGLVAGSLSEILPAWCLIAIGALHCFIGYGWLWLIVTGRSPILPIWAICILILIGTNSDTYLSTSSVVTNLYNFPKSRGHVVGLLKGFNGLCSAILTQIYMTFFAPDQASYLLIVALSPLFVPLPLMFFLRRINSESELRGRPSDTLGFYFIYGDCLIIAAYLMGVLILQDVATVSFKASLAITLVLLAMVIFPLATPLVTWAAERRGKIGSEEAGATTILVSGIRGRVLDKEKETQAPLLGGYEVLEQSKEVLSADIVPFAAGSPIKPTNLPALISKMKDEKFNTSIDDERKKKISAMKEKMIMTAAEGPVMEKGPWRGQEFTLWQVLMKVDSWLLFFVLVCGAGTAMTAINNMGQISQSQGYTNSSIFVSITSIFNFLGRILGGYFSELLARTYKLPRSWALAMAQGIMVVGHLITAMGWPSTLYVSTILIGAGYGSHWGIVPPILSELFGMKSFGILFNVYTLALPIGVLFFSNFLAGYLYDLEAAKQQQTSYIESMLASTSTSCSGAICFRLTFLVMAGACIFGIFLVTILSIRTRSVYKTMYDSECSPVITTLNNQE